MNDTTLPARSFDVGVTAFARGLITVSWTPTATRYRTSHALACVSPVVVTAEQVKIFQQSTGISFP